MPVGTFRGAVLCGALSIALAATAFSPSAVAQSAESQAADALFRQAKALMDQGDLEPACEKFAASQALEPGLGTLLYLGDCYERAGRFASALATFRDAAELAEQHDDATRLRLAQVRVSALEPRAPKLEIRPPSAPQKIDLQITVAGAPLPSSDLGRPLPHDAGRYEIRFSAPGYEPFVSQIELKNASSVVVTVPRLVALQSAGPRAPAHDEAPAEHPSDGSTQRTLGWVAGGTGAVLLGTAIVLGALAGSKNRDSKSNCAEDDPNRCSSAGVDQRKDAQNLATAATVATVVGGIALAGGVVLYVSAPSTEDPVGQAGLIGVAGAF
jgi:tetratricopeptide repeat protein